MNLYVRRLASELGKAGIQTDIFTRREDPAIDTILDLEPGARVIHLDAGPARQIPKAGLSSHVPALIRAFSQYLRADTQRYDLIHSHYWLSGFVALRSRERSSIPVIHMFHTLSRLKEFYYGRPDPRDTLFRAEGERCVIASSDVLVGATPGELYEMERLYTRPGGQFVVIPPGVDMEHFAPRGRALSRSRLGIDADRVVLFVGRLERIKGLDLLLDTMAEAPDDLRHGLQLVVAGGGSRNAVQSYQRRAERLGIAHMVDFRGIVPQEELPYLYSAADVCAVPSAYESFGMAAVESMACRTPVVAFRVGGLASSIRHGCSGFLAAPGQKQEFAGLLFDALRSRNLESMGRQARLAAQRFDWRGVASETIQLYENTVTKHVSLAPASGDC